jgi:hypothetical protein
MIYGRILSFKALGQIGRVKQIFKDNDLKIEVVVGGVKKKTIELTFNPSLVRKISPSSHFEKNTFNLADLNEKLTVLKDSNSMVVTNDHFQINKGNDFSY